MPLFEASHEAAVAAGDINAAGRHGRLGNLFWFAQHVAAMMALAGLPGRNCVPFEGTLDELADEATAFILRAIGVREAAIAAGVGRVADCGGGLTRASGHGWRPQDIREGGRGRAQRGRA